MKRGISPRIFFFTFLSQIFGHRDNGKALCRVVNFFGTFNFQLLTPFVCFSGSWCNYTCGVRKQQRYFSIQFNWTETSSNIHRWKSIKEASCSGNCTFRWLRSAFNFINDPRWFKASPRECQNGTTATHRIFSKCIFQAQTVSCGIKQKS